MMLRSLLRDRITAVWLGLIAATLISWLLGVGHQLPHMYAGISIIAIAFVKVHCVGSYFMELRHAPVKLRVIFESWTLLVGVILAGLYLFA